MFNRVNDGQRKVLCVLDDFSNTNQKIHCEKIISTALELVDAGSEFMWIRESMPEFTFTLDEHFFAPAYENIRVAVGKDDEITGLLEGLLTNERFGYLFEDRAVVRYVLLDLSTRSSPLSPSLTSSIISLLVESADNIQVYRETDNIQVIALLPDSWETVRAMSRHPVVVQHGLHEDE
ncbi:unnamed protein product [Bursaphelenchus xylophilus]|uniref:(pine wood nematode) hypothetical protein n=1 Tax=Bursaphelenchus xylophilus TaxID=6326 RepID=A0A7I8WGW3_BURXY|nr:unnamed protein product [Bursaphelenchus xylophilus]CAG9110520.1 unnamed protein product [Bursaphelenchus xylophilus]